MRFQLHKNYPSEFLFLSSVMERGEWNLPALVRISSWLHFSTLCFRYWEDLSISLSLSFSPSLSPFIYILSSIYIYMMFVSWWIDLRSVFVSLGKWCAYGLVLELPFRSQLYLQQWQWRAPNTEDWMGRYLQTVGPVKILLCLLSFSVSICCLRNILKYQDRGDGI